MIGSEKKKVVAMSAYMRMHAAHGIARRMNRAAVCAWTYTGPYLLPTSQTPPDPQPKTPTPHPQAAGPGPPPRALYELLQVGGADFRAVLVGEQETDLVGQPVDQPVLLGCGAVEEVHQAPAQIFDVAFQRGVAHRREEITPDGGYGLLQGLGGRGRHAAQVFGAGFEVP